MVALDVSETQHLGSVNNENGVKKSKKKKNKRTDTSDQSEIAKKKSKKEKRENKESEIGTENISNNPQNGIDCQIEYSKDEDKERRRKKKEAKRLKKQLERELNENKEKEETTMKRKIDGKTQDLSNISDETLPPQKKKLKESDEVNEVSPTTKEHKKKKSKKSKKEKSTQVDEPASENLKTSTEIVNPSPVENDTPKKKKKKDKKAKLNEKTDVTEANVLKENDKAPDNDNENSSFKKDFYSVSYSSLILNNEEEKAKAEKYRSEKTITVYGKGKADGQYYPITDFKRLGFDNSLLTSVKNFKEPTPIQASVWPIIASGRDCIGIAETGSGKTLAFSIPALAHLKHRLTLEKNSYKNKRRGPMMLIVAPTRELAQQSQDVLEVAGKSCGIRSVSVYGGVSKEGQRRSLNAKGMSPYEIVVATPGRLIDLMDEGSCDLSDVSYLVLDEADRMLDQGFERDVRKIIAATHPHRQTCLFSATWPDTVRELAHEFLKNPMKITIGSDDLAAGSTIEQIVEIFEDERQRQWKLIEVLKKHQKSDKHKRVLIFVLYKKEATRIEQFLQGKGFNATSIQGDKSQEARQKAVDQFKAGSVPLLVATDVAARGLDIPGVDLVVNFSFPLTIEDYVHRIGRTGRAGKKGVAHTFFQRQADKLRAGELVKVLRDAGQPVPDKMLSFDLSIRKKEHKLYGAFGPKDNNIPMKQPSKIVFGDD